MRIVMCASEMFPFAKTGGLADVLGALPLALERMGHEVVCVIPYYAAAAACGAAWSAVAPDMRMAVVGKGVRVYAVVHEGFYGREGLYGTKDGDYPDNAQRFSYYCKRALSFLKESGFQADIIHCHDWQSGLIPAYLLSLYGKDRVLGKARTVFTIHNLAYQGLFPASEFSLLGLGKKYFTPEGMEFYGQVSFLKAGLAYAGHLTTVSPTYSREIQTSEFGCGLEGLLRTRREHLTGILNGLDYQIWNPEHDPHLKKTYSAEDLSGKAAQKEALQQECGFSSQPKAALVGIVSRLAEQKGFDILAEAIPALCEKRLQLVVLGTGEQKYQELLQEAAEKFPEKVRFFLKFDEALAHRIYAGADFFLMPSRYEPCGLGQMIALRYGTIPFVYKTGGLADTVTPHNGFLFDVYTPSELEGAVDAGLDAFMHPVLWQRMVRNAMESHFSWEDSAQHYTAVYEALHAQ